MCTGTNIQIATLCLIEYHVGICLVGVRGVIFKPLLRDFFDMSRVRSDIAPANGQKDGTGLERYHLELRDGTLRDKSWWVS